MRNIITDLINGKMRDMDKEVKEGKHDRRFLKAEIYTAVWNSPKFKARLKLFIANQQQGWPDIDAYSAYIYKEIERILRKQRLIVKDGKRQLVPIFPSFRVPGRRERLYCRITRLYPNEMRSTGRHYVELGDKNAAKGKILLTLADEVESRQLQFATDDLVKEVTETLLVSGQL